MKKSRLSLYLLLLLVIVVLSGYIYAQKNITEKGRFVFETIKDVDWRVDSYVFFPPSINITLTYSIRNPTTMPLEIYMDIDFYTSDYKISNLYKTIKLLPSDEANFDIKLVYTSEILEKVYSNEANGSFIMNGWFKVKGKVLLFPVEYIMIFDHEDVLSVLPAFDSISTP